MVIEIYSANAIGSDAEGQVRCFLRAKAPRIDLIRQCSPKDSIKRNYGGRLSVA